MKTLCKQETREAPMQAGDKRSPPFVKGGWGDFRTPVADFAPALLSSQGLSIVTLNGVKGLKSLLQVKADSPIKTFRFFVAEFILSEVEGLLRITLQGVTAPLQYEN